jgi:hypothetical protein
MDRLCKRQAASGLRTAAVNFAVCRQEAQIFAETLKYITLHLIRSSLSLERRPTLSVERQTLKLTQLTDCAAQCAFIVAASYIAHKTCMAAGFAGCIVALTPCAVQPAES